MVQRKYKITVRISEQERAHLKAQTKAAGLKIEPFIRKLIMGSQIKPHPPDEYAALLLALSEIERRISQIVKCSGGRNHIDSSEMQEAVQLAHSAWKHVRDSL